MQSLSSVQRDWGKKCLHQCGSTWVWWLREFFSLFCAILCGWNHIGKGPASEAPTCLARCNSCSGTHCRRWPSTHRMGTGSSPASCLPWSTHGTSISCHDSTRFRTRSGMMTGASERPHICPFLRAELIRIEDFHFFVSFFPQNCLDGRHRILLSLFSTPNSISFRQFVSSSTKEIQWKQTPMNLTFLGWFHTRRWGSFMLVVFKIPQYLFSPNEVVGEFGSLESLGLNTMDDNGYFLFGLSLPIYFTIRFECTGVHQLGPSTGLLEGSVGGLFARTLFF